VQDLDRHVPLVAHEANRSLQSELRRELGVRRLINLLRLEDSYRLWCYVVQRVPERREKAAEALARLHDRRRLDPLRLLVAWYAVVRKGEVHLLLLRPDSECARHLAQE